MFPLRQTLLVAFALVALNLGAATVVQADPIITPVGTADNRTDIYSDQYNLVRFTFSSSYSNVSIAASLTADAAGHTGTAFLMN